MKSQLLPLVNPGRLCAHGHILTTILSNQELQQNVSVPCLPWKVENWANPALPVPGRHRHIGLI